MQTNEYDGLLDVLITLLVTCFKFCVGEIRLVTVERGRKMKIILKQEKAMHRMASHSVSSNQLLERPMPIFA